MRGQFLVEVAGAAGQAGTALGSVTDLEELFGAWVHQVYHQAVHGETGQAPAARFAAAGSRLRQIAPEAIGEAFLWQDFRTVTKTATISLHGNRYQTDPALCGRKVEVLYNPADLTTGIRVRWRGTDMGAAVPHVIGRHSHPGLAPVLPGAQDLHLGGVDDADEEPGIPGGVVGKVPVHMGKVPDSRQIFGGDCCLRAGAGRERRGRLQPAGAMVSSRPRVSTLIRAHQQVCSSPWRRPRTSAAAPRCSSAAPSSSVRLRGLGGRGAGGCG